MDFGPVWLDKLQSLVHEEGFTQKEAAKWLNVSVYTVWRYLNGFKKERIKYQRKKLYC